LQETPDFRFPRERRLKSRDAIREVFERGRAAKSWPLIAQFCPWELPADVPSQWAFSVSKRRFPRAVDRNRIKRLMREAWRHERHALDAAVGATAHRYAVVILFVGQELPEFSEVQKRMRDVLQKLQRNLS
jgi:ribonuclease P protein component